MGISYSPLRYPGGKAKLAPYVKSIFELNGITDGIYAEAYAGGAGIAIELILHEYASEIYINDISQPVAAFWRTVLKRPDELCELITKRPVTIAEWDRQKAIQIKGKKAGDLELGFSTFFLNRTNRSGILNGGIIGGRAQEGEWKIDARYNKKTLIERIQAISNLQKRIHFSQLDAIIFMRDVAKKLPKKSLTYLDPPYFVKGSALYHHHYEPKDHAEVAKCVPTALRRQNWIVSYDNVPEIRKLYSEFSSLSYKLGYSARKVYEGTEIMYFSPGLVAPEPCGVMKKAA